MQYSVEDDRQKTLPTKNLLGRRNTSDNFSGFIYILYAVPPYSAGTIIKVIVYRGWTKPPVLFFGVLHIFVELKTIPKQTVLVSTILG